MLLFSDTLATIKSDLATRKIKSPPKEWQLGSKGDVVIVHGWAGRWAYVWDLGNYVNKLGYKVHVLPKLGRNFKKVRIGTKILEEYLRKNDVRGVILLAHSKGGIICKSFMDTSKLASKVRKVITISTPYNGTLLGYLLVGGLFEQAPTSSLTSQLRKDKRFNHLFVNLIAKRDNLVIPNKNLVLEGALNKTVDVEGHMLILQSSQLLDELRKWLT